MTKPVSVLQLERWGARFGCDDSKLVISGGPSVDAAVWADLLQLDNISSLNLEKRTAL